MSEHLVLVSGAEKTCGVEEFARLSARHIGARTQELGGPLKPAGDVILNLPVVAWKKRLVAPIVAAVRSRASGRQLTLILHEWADLALARRISYLPLLLLATRILFSSPEVMAQFDSTPVSRVVTRRRGILPIPPNFTVPDWTQSSALSDTLAAERAKGRFVLAQFGSIYPRKDPMIVLDAAAEMVRRGIDVRAIFVGSFIGDAIESEFRARVDALGLQRRVDVTGYVRSAPELYGIFAEVDAFLYPLSEGLTSRRASVLAAALSGRPVVVSAPQRADSFAHHRLFKALLASGGIHLVPREADASALADAVMATRGTQPVRMATQAAIDNVWDDVAAILDA